MGGIGIIQDMCMLWMEGGCWYLVQRGGSSVGSELSAVGVVQTELTHPSIP